MEVNSKIFKRYDIRGVHPSQINEKTAYLIGRTFAFFLAQKYHLSSPVILVNYDVRSSSKPLFENLISGLVDQGAKVLNGGTATTPIHFFGNWHLKVDGSIMVTASHNPKEYNGFKLFLREVNPLATDKGTEILYEIIKKGSFEKERSGNGRVEEVNFFDQYLEFLEKNLPKVDFSKLKFAADFSNGCWSLFFKEIAKKFSLNYIGIFEEPDGNFPNHEPNPLRTELLTELKKTISDQKLNFGVAFDGDGDRIMFFDEKGYPQRADFILGILAKYYLKEAQSVTKDLTVVCDARASRGVRDVLEKEKIKMIKSRVGYPFIKDLMRKYKAALGVELSGHFFWKENHYSESPILTLFRIMEVLEKLNRPLSELVKPIAKYFSSKEINFEVENKLEKIKELERIYRDGEISKIDGLTVEYKDWWFNVRPSNTEPVLRLTVEAETEELLEEKIRELTEMILGQSSSF